MRRRDRARAVATLALLALTACGTPAGTPVATNGLPTRVPSSVETPSPQSSPSPTPLPTTDLDTLGVEYAGLAFIREVPTDGGDVWQVFVVGVDGIARQVTHYDAVGDFEGAVAVRWSPDGSRLAVTLGRPVAVAIQVMDADGSGVIELRGARDVEWSPDGTRLVTTDPWDVHLPGSYPAVRVLDPAHGSDVEVGAGLFPHWYAGDVVSYYRAIGETASSPGEPTIFLHAADGSGEEDVLITGQREAVPTPDRDRLAYVGGDGTCGVPCSRLTLADGAGEYVIGDAWSPAWSRDGQTIAYLVGEDAHVGLYDASAGERTLAAVATSIAWAPYGGRLALEVENPYLTAVQVIDTVTGSELVVTLGASPSWVSQP